MKLLKLFTLIGLLLSTTACMTRLDATVPANQTLPDLENIYVEHFSPDKRNLNHIIADKLTLLGYPATPVDRNEVVSEDAKIIVTYVDNWQWDITNYMIKIKIDVRDAKNKQLLATGESFRTSLARKSPSFMIQETLETIFKELDLPYNNMKYK